MALLDDILKQGKTLDDLLLRAAGLGQKTALVERYYGLLAYAVFPQGANNVQTISFNVPTGHAFRARRLCAYPQVRMVSPQPATQGPSDNTFRPTFWTWGAAGDIPLLQAFDAAFEFSVGARSLQNSPYSSYHLFGGSLAYASGSARNRAMQTVGAYDINLDLLPGESLSGRITPLYTAPFVDQSGSPTGRRYEYRVVCVLEGTKVIA